MEFSVVRSQNRYLVPLFYWAKEGSSFLYWFWRLFQASLSWCSHIRLLFRNLCFFVCLFYYYYYYYKFSFLFFLIGRFGVRFFSPSYRALLLLFFFLSCFFFLWSGALEYLFLLLRFLLGKQCMLLWIVCKIFSDVFLNQIPYLYLQASFISKTSCMKSFEDIRKYPNWNVRLEYFQQLWMA